MAIADDSAAIWQRVIHFDEELSPAAARALLKLRFSERDRALMNELSTKGTCRYPDARGAKPARHFRAAGLVARHRPFQRPAGPEEKAQEGLLIRMDDALIEVLAMNLPHRVAQHAALIAEEVFPPAVR